MFSQPTRNGGNILETAAMAMIGLASAAAIAIELLRRSNLVAGLPGLDQLLPLLLR